jgi:chemotaxis protein methyltransferase CheR
MGRILTVSTVYDEQQRNNDREFRMTNADFDRISKLALQYSGIVLARHKRNMVYSRIARRVRALKLNCFSDYLNYLECNHAVEASEFINALTTNLTSFFRENHHFNFLKEELFPKLAIINQSSRKLRIWSAGCSIGQEAYSIAVMLKESVFPLSWDVKILATDLDSNVIETGREAIYPSEHIDGIDSKIVKKYFNRSNDGQSVQVKDALRKMVFFKRLNLLEEWPMTGPFDVIFCRNVVIYFNKETQNILFDRYADMLPIGGHLIIGHSENINGVTDRFENLGNTIYRKKR